MTSGKYVVLLAPFLIIMLFYAACFKSMPARHVTIPPLPNVRISGSGTVSPLLERLIATSPDGLNAELIPGTNSGGAIKGVKEGIYDIATINRPLLESEKAANLSYYPFVRDALVFATSPDLKIKNINSADVKSIYLHGLFPFREVKAPEGGFVILDRDEDDSAKRLLRDKIIGKDAVTTKAIKLSSAGDMLAAIQSTPGSLGYTSFGLANLKASRINILAFNRLLPQGMSLSKGEYALSMTFALVFKEPRSSAVTRLLTFLEEEQIKTFMRSFGYGPAS